MINRILSAVAVLGMSTQALLAQEGQTIQATAQVVGGARLTGEVVEPLLLQAGETNPVVMGDDLNLKFSNPHGSKGVFLPANSIEIYNGTDLVSTVSPDDDGFFIAPDTTKTIDLDGKDFDGRDVDADALEPGYYSVKVAGYILDAATTEYFKVNGVREGSSNLMGCQTSFDAFVDVQVVKFSGRYFAIGVSEGRDSFTTSDDIEFWGRAGGSFSAKAYFRIERVTDCGNPYPEVVCQQTCDEPADEISLSKDPQRLFTWNASEAGAGTYKFFVRMGDAERSCTFTVIEDESMEDEGDAFDQDEE